eukprot:Polyplicarium_translucidae@DN3217_c0_g1_i7.p3
MAPLADSGRLLSIEQRMSQLENTIGIATGAHLQLPFADLHSGLRHVASRLAMLDAARLDGLSRRILTATAELEALQKKREKMPQGESPVVEKLYELCERWKLAAPALPATLQRLQLLRALHQEAVGFSHRMT